MERTDTIDGLVTKFTSWAETLSPEEQQLLSGVLDRLTGDEVHGYSSSELLLSSNLLGIQLRELLLLG